MADPIERVLGDRWASAADAIGSLADDAEARRLVGAAAARLSRAAPLERARLGRLAQLTIESFPHAAHAWPAGLETPSRLASNAVLGLVADEVVLASKPTPAAVVPGQMVVATSPVRVDLAGGWSDTPPICHELGGTVVNAAFTLAGRQPLQAVAQLCDEPVVRLTSIDLGRSVEFTSTSEVLAYDNPHDWAALAKAALVLSGLTPSNPDVPLGRWLEGVGGGVRLTVFSALPKGSGLGTSSILGATVLGALSRLTGEAPSRDGIASRTSLLEQLMRTGGGWQDQLGGIVPGCKVLRTDAGGVQTPRVEPIALPDACKAAIRDRVVVYYTGLQRLAANILQKVVSRYLARDPEALAIIHDLKAGAERMSGELASGDVDAFARTLLEYWELKKRLDPGSTTDQVESLLALVRDDLVGYGLPGAGGGGFLFLVAKDAEASRRVRDRLKVARPNRTARLYDAAIDEVGMSVSVV